ncbi:MAG: hypothetical protein R3E03_00415 [Novosphingobium sp.]
MQRSIERLQDEFHSQQNRASHKVMGSIPSWLLTDHILAELDGGSWCGGWSGAQTPAAG